MLLVLVCVAIIYACCRLGLRGLIYVFPMASVFFFIFRLSRSPAYREQWTERTRPHLGKQWRFGSTLFDVAASELPYH